MAVMTFYSEEDIHEAKIKLMRAAQDAVDIRDIKENRQNTAQRSAKEKEVEDIIQIMKWIDEDDEVTIEFVAKDLTRLPPSAPEAGGSTTSLIEIMGRQTSQHMELRNLVTEIKSEMQNLKEDVENNKRLLERRSTRDALYATAAAPSSSTQGQQESRMKQPAVSTNEITTAGPANIVKADGQPVETYQTAGRNGTSRLNKGSGTSRPNKGNTAPPKSNRKQGKADASDVLQGGPSQIFVQITNVRPHVTADNLSAYIANHTENGIKEVSIQDTSSEGWYTKRYILEFDSKHKDTVLSEDFWPGNIYYKRWFPERKKPDASQNKT